MADLRELAERAQGVDPKHPPTAAEYAELVARRAEFRGAASPDVILALLDRAEQAESTVERLRVALDEVLAADTAAENGDEAADRRWDLALDAARAALDPATSEETVPDEGAGSE